MRICIEGCRRPFNAEVYTKVEIGLPAPTLPARGTRPKNCRFPETLAQTLPRLLQSARRDIAWVVTFTLFQK